MAGARAVLGIFCLALCTPALQAIQMSTDPSLVGIEGEQDIWDFTACTGSMDLPRNGPYCYTGAKLGEFVTVKVNSFESDGTTGDGQILVTGSGLSPVRCERNFIKSQQALSVTNLEECLPPRLKNARTPDMKYCSDQDKIMLNTKVAALPVQMILYKAPCPAIFLEESQNLHRNDLLSHSAWIWDTNACTGSSDPPTHAPFCYSGSKMGEIVTIKVSSFDSVSSAGSVLVTGSGLTPVKCERGFSKAEQLISVPQLTDCLPSTVKPTGMKYCSDQNQVLLDAKVGVVPVQLVLIPSPCPPVFLEESAQVQDSPQDFGTAPLVSLYSRATHALLASDWAWDSTTCTGTNDPQALAKHAPFCYSGSKLGEVVTIKVNSFDSISSTGSVLVIGSGLTRLKCERGFSKAQQMISVTKLEECLPSTVKPSGMKYCSDQNKVILDATVGLMSVEMVLDPTECPEAASPSSTLPPLMHGQILPSGVQRLLRRP